MYNTQMLQAKVWRCSDLSVHRGWWVQWHKSASKSRKQRQL